MWFKSIVFSVAVMTFVHGYVASNTTQDYLDGDNKVTWLPFAKVQSVLKLLEGNEEWKGCHRSIQNLLKNIEEWDIDSLKLVLFRTYRRKIYTFLKPKGIRSYCQAVSEGQNEESRRRNILASLRHNKALSKTLEKLMITILSPQTASVHHTIPWALYELTYFYQPLPQEVVKTARGVTYVPSHPPTLCIFVEQITFGALFLDFDWVLYNRDLIQDSVIDSWGKPNSGILEGNMNQYGNFDECLNSKTEHDGDSSSGKYCLVSLELKVPSELKEIGSLIHSHYAMRKGSKEFSHRLPHFSDFKWGSCIPSTCPSEIVEMILNDTSIHMMGEEFIVHAKAREEQCYTKEESQSSKMSRLPWIYFGLIFGLSLVGTVTSMFPGKLPGGEYLECFSLSKNWEKLLETKSSDFSELHGIKSASAIGLLLSHKHMAMLYNPYINRTSMSEVLGRPWSVIGRTAIIYTDGFILLSGYLSSLSFFKDLRNKGRIDVMESSVSRYWRLVPNLMTVIVFCTCVLPFMNTGPQWNVVVHKHALLCHNSWWRNLLFIHNFFGFENMCLTHTHQLGIDFQLFLIAPVVVYLLWKRPRTGCYVALTLATLSSAFRYIVTHSKNLSVVIYFGIPVSQLLDTANYSYILPHHRLTVYLMGIGVCFFLMKFPDCVFNKVQITLLWIVAVLSGMAAMIGPYHMASVNYEYDAQEAALYNTFSPILWGAFLGWGIVAASYGYAGWLGKLMAWDKFQIMSRLSYSIYLVQFPVFFYNVGTKRHPETYSPSGMFNLEEYAVIIIFSVLLVLMVEMPVNNLRSLYKRKHSSGQEFDSSMVDPDFDCGIVNRTRRMIQEDEGDNFMVQSNESLDVD